MHNAMRRLWEWWKRVAKKFGDFQARVILLLFYFIVLGPFALGVRWGSAPLAIKLGSPRGWGPRPEEGRPAMDCAKRQF